MADGRQGGPQGPYRGRGIAALPLGFGQQDLQEHEPWGQERDHSPRCAVFRGVRDVAEQVGELVGQDPGAGQVTPPEVASIRTVSLAAGDERTTTAPRRS